MQYPCYMGINIPTREELIANKLSPAQLAKHVGESLELNSFLIVYVCIYKMFQFAGADSLSYLSVEGLVSAVRFHMEPAGGGPGGHCTACLTGQYPGGLPDHLTW